MISAMAEENSDEETYSEYLFCLLLNYQFNRDYKEHEFHTGIFFAFENDHNSWDEFHVFI